MNKIILCTDSTNDLTKELIQKNDIRIVPLHVNFEKEEYRDGVDIDIDKFYERIEETGMLPKSSAVSLSEMIDFFTSLVKEDTDIIFTCISSELSSTFQNAVIAKKSLDDAIADHIYLLDSKNLSTGIGLLLLKMADFRDEGKSAKEIIDLTTPLVKNVRAQFSVKKLDFLHKGGRCSGTTKVFGTMLRMRLILRVIDGKIVLDDKVMGHYNKALNLQIKDLIDNIDNMDLTHVMITHSHGKEDADYILENIPQEVKDKIKNIYVTQAGCVISTHCGEHTVGILYIRNEPVVASL